MVGKKKPKKAMLAEADEFQRLGIVDIYAARMGAINSVSLFLGVFTRLLTGVATMWVSGYCFITVNASSGVAVSQVSRSSLARMAGMRCLTLWISAMSLLAGIVT